MLLSWINVLCTRNARRDDFINLETRRRRHLPRVSIEPEIYLVVAVSNAT
jgi:hypothetical protein